MIWLTSDHHFFNENIIKYCNRPYSNSQHMGKGLIMNYNRMVLVDDTVYFLGDLSLKGIEFKPSLNALVGRMNGEKHLILGNHDRLSVRDYLEMGFKSVHSSLDLDMENLTLVHDPAEAYAYPSRIYLCGHVHTLYLTHKNIINVGVDVWNQKPVSLVKIREMVNNIIGVRSLSKCEIGHRFCPYHKQDGELSFYCYIIDHEHRNCPFVYEEEEGLEEGAVVTKIKEEG